MPTFQQYIETVNPFLIPKNEKEYKKFANKSKLPNIQNYLKSNQIIPTGGPEEVKEPTSRQAKDKFQTIKNKIINSSWFKKFLNKNNLSYRHTSEMGDSINYSGADIGLIKNDDKFFKVRINLQTGLCYKSRISGSKNGWGSSVTSLKDKELAQDLSSETKVKKFILGRFEDDWLNGKTSDEIQKYEIQMNDNKILLRNSIIKSHWFKEFLKALKFKLSDEATNESFKSVEISLANKTHVYCFNLQTGSFQLKPINGTWRRIDNPQISVPWKQISKHITEDNFKEYLIENLGPNIR